MASGASEIVDRLVLADEAAQAFGDDTRARLERGIGQHIVGLHGLGRPREQNIDGDAEEQCGENAARGHGYSATETAAAFACARLGAPTRKRRSDSDTAPPKNITSAPSQMSLTSGLK